MIMYQYDWALIVPICFWIFHLARGCQGKSYPWITFLLVLFVTIISLIVLNCLRTPIFEYYDVTALGRIPIDPAQRALRTANAWLKVFLWALIPLELFVLSAWAIVRAFRRIS